MVRDDRREDERVDCEQQQRVDEGPEEAENRAPVTRLELACDQTQDQAAISEELGEIGKGGEEFCNPTERILARARHLEPDGATLSIAIRARSKSMSTVAAATRSWARFLAASARAEVDLVRPLGDLRQNRYPIRLHFSESERDRQVVFFLPRRNQSSPIPRTQASGV